VANDHPYIGKPDYQFWKLETAIEHPESFDPVTRTSFRIGRSEPVVTAGSCFAQHVGRHLARGGFNFLVTEAAHPIVPAQVADKFNYGVFSARYGNVYTARQFKQLLLRAYGLFDPIETCWRTAEHQIVDPFRPQIQEGGFISEDELHADRAVHFKALRTAMESMAVFVFTLGLTESWMDIRDGSVFPLAPGVAGGQFDSSIFMFHNFGVEGVVADLQWCIDFIRERNPAVRFLMTVSPVPLNATAIDRHVYVSTASSKATLRVAAEVICSQNPQCDYFPAYEIITSPFARGSYFGPDCREVTEAGVQHVMSTFIRHYADELPDPGTIDPGGNESLPSYLENMENMMEALCDEERISNK